jgi:hypothetical protein
MSYLNRIDSIWTKRLDGIERHAERAGCDFNDDVLAIRHLIDDYYEDATEGLFFEFGKLAPLRERAIYNALDDLENRVKTEIEINSRVMKKLKASQEIVNIINQTMKQERDIYNMITRDLGGTDND